MARAPLPTTTSERVTTEAGRAPPLTKTRWIGRASAAPGATSITAPSSMNAVFSATATLSVGTTLPRCLAISGSPAASACAIERIVRPGSSAARSDNSGTKAPSTNTMRRASIAASIAPALAACAFAAASGGPASGLASRIRARRSVYFHSSTRRCGRPSAAKRPNACCAHIGERAVARQPSLGRREALRQRGLGRSLDRVNLGVHFTLTPPRPGTARSRSTSSSSASSLPPVFTMRPLDSTCTTSGTM